MENHINQSPAIPKWSALLTEAVTKPPTLTATSSKTGWSFFFQTAR